MSAIPAELHLASPWKRALPALLLLWLAMLLLYRDTALAMVQIWARSDTFAHAFLVPPISLWLAWRKRERLARLTPRPQPWLLLPMAAIGVLWLLAELVAVNAATQFALVALLVLAVPAVLGLAVAKELAFPLGFLFFAVPFGEFMTPYMIGWTADATIMALRASGIPVYREGMQFVIPSGNWSVVEACSGVRALFSLSFFSLAYGYLFAAAGWQRWLLFAATVPVAIFVNAFRVYLTGVLGEIDIAYARGFYHSLSGIFVLALALAMLMGVQMLLARFTARANAG